MCCMQIFHLHAISVGSYVAVPINHQLLTVSGLRSQAQAEKPVLHRRSNGYFHQHIWTGHQGLASGTGGLALGGDPLCPEFVEYRKIAFDVSEPAKRGKQLRLISAGAR